MTIHIKKLFKKRKTTLKHERKQKKNRLLTPFLLDFNNVDIKFTL